MKKLLCLLMTLTLFSLCRANSYFVSMSQGNDANTAAQAQNSATPWKTWDKVNSAIADGSITAGSTVFFKRGDAWLMPNGFIISKGLTFDQYGPGSIKPYVTGFITVPSNRWTLINSTTGIWETTDQIVNPPSNTLNLMVLNGTPYARGRTPNVTAVNKGWLTYDGHTSSTITDNTNPFNTSYIGATTVVRTSHGEIEDGPITNVSGNVISINTSSFHTPIADNGYGYFVENDLKCVDQFGEWFYNKGTKKLDLCVGPLNNPANFTVQYPSVDTMLQPKASNIIFRGIQFTGANKVMAWSNSTGTVNTWFKSCDMGYSGGDFIDYYGKGNSGVDSCYAIWAMSNGFSFGSKFTTGAYVLNTTLRNVGLFEGHLTKNSVIRAGYAIYSGDQNSFTADSGMTCRNDVVRNTGYAGIFVGGDKNLIENCYVDTVCSARDDGGCIYYFNFGNKTIVGSTFRNNLCLHSIGAPGGTPTTSSPSNNWGYGIYMDDNTKRAKIYNNTMAYCNGAGMFIHNTARSRIENNLFYNNEQRQLNMADDNIGDSIYLDTVRFNVMMPIKSSQLIYYFALGTSATKDSKNFDTWGLIDKNILAMPFSTNVALLNHFGGILFHTYGLSEWRSTWDYDLTSTGMPFAVSSLSRINFVYNIDVYNSNDFNFPCNVYISVRDSTYINKRVLKPVGADVLMIPD